MDTTRRELDCKSIMEMMQEAPEAAAVFIDMIAELGEADENCIKRIRELLARHTVAA